MGDHRISLKIEFRMHGHKADLDAWWNFTASHEVDGIDYRAVEWLRQQHAIAMGRFFEEQYGRVALDEAHRENEERKQLMRLKAKYEP
jgi:hypothetical protein